MRESPISPPITITNERSESRLPAPFRFRLWHLFYLTAVVGSALATYGGQGCAVLGIAVGIVWLGFRTVRTLPFIVVRDEWSGNHHNLIVRWVCEILLITGILGVLSILVMPSVGIPRSVMRQYFCTVNLHWLSFALSNYHDTHRSFPPAFLADEKGQPRHSWRVLMLPYLDNQALYNQYRFDEPWDGPHNRELLNETPDCYRCREDDRTGNPIPSGHTTYLAIRGPNTAWPGAEPFRGTFEELPHVVVMEVPSKPVPWTAPVDITLEEYLQLYQQVSPPPQAHSVGSNYFVEFGGHCNATCTGGHSEGIPADLPVSVRKTMLVTGNRDDEVRKWDALTTTFGRSSYRIRWGNILRLVTFLLLVIVPVLSKKFWLST